MKEAHCAPRKASKGLNGLLQESKYIMRGVASGGHSTSVLMILATTVAVIYSSDMTGDVTLTQYRVVCSLDNGSPDNQLPVRGGQGSCRHPLE